MEEGTMDVHFSCQRCCQPLRLDPTLNPISRDYYYDLVSHNAQPSNAGESDANRAKVITLPDSSDEEGRPFKSGDANLNQTSSSSSSASPTSSPRKVVRPSPDVLCKTIEPIRKSERRTDDYSLINDAGCSSSNLNSTSFIHSSLLSNFDQSTADGSKDLKLQIQLFDILSDQSDIDHPLCEECADFVIKQMDHHLKILEDECTDYSAYLKQIESQETTTDEEIEELKAKLKSMQTTQASMIGELKELNKEQKRVEEEVDRNMNELKRLRADEDKYWHEYNNVKFNFFQCEEEQSTLENKLRYAKTFYNKLKNTSVFNSTFYIWHNGEFGTINGFRMGRLPSMQIEWHEINAGWGQCALLLSSLANKIGLTFKRFKIVPYGNYSFIESLDDKSKQLPLYTSGGLKYYFHQKFDQAMVAFLDCLQQFNEECHRQDENDFNLPYEMDLKGNIHDIQNNYRVSIKININTEEKWTKALKFMLTNLKWALAWVSNTHHD